MNDLGHNSHMTARPERVIVLPEANSGLPLKGEFERMAKRRAQSPFVKVIGGGSTHGKTSSSKGGLLGRESA
jgi:hypothetical protein